MIRVELIANLSVQDDLLEALNKASSDFNYTIVPLAHGKGNGTPKFGTPTWPEENFILISYLEDEAEAAVREQVAGLKARMDREGIKLFILHDS